MYMYLYVISARVVLIMVTINQMLHVVMYRKITVFLRFLAQQLHFFYADHDLFNDFLNNQKLYPVQIRSVYG